MVETTKPPEGIEPPSCGSPPHMLANYTMGAASLVLVLVLVITVVVVVVVAAWLKQPSPQGESNPHHAVRNHIC